MHLDIHKQDIFPPIVITCPLKMRGREKKLNCFYFRSKKGNLNFNLLRKLNVSNFINYCRSKTRVSVASAFSESLKIRHKVCQKTSLKVITISKKRWQRSTWKQKLITYKKTKRRPKLKQIHIRYEIRPTWQKSNFFISRWKTNLKHNSYLNQNIEKGYKMKCVKFLWSKLF